MTNSYVDKGFTEIITIKFDNELRDIQQLIYDKTKKLLSEHDGSISLEKKLKVPFKVIPSPNDWSILMGFVASGVEPRGIKLVDNFYDDYKKIYEAEILKKKYFSIIKRSPLYICKK